MSCLEEAQKPIKKKRGYSREDVKAMSRTELEDALLQVSAHNAQLSSLLQRSQNTTHTHKHRPFDFSKFGKRHVLLKFAYLGWNYHGYAVQEDPANTIERVLFDALIKTKLIESRESSNYHRCGRTDKGVSAFAQVISITLRSKSLTDAGVCCVEELPYVDILNRVLPSDIRMLAWCPVPDNFSARFDCLSRTYKYFFPLGDLDLCAMQDAAQRLVGCHDFRNLAKMDVGNGVVNFVRSIDHISIDYCLENGEENLFIKEIEGVQKTTNLIDHEASFTPNTNLKENRGYRFCVATIRAKAFLWHQVRAIMAVIFLVGERKEMPSVVSSLLDIKKYPQKPQYSLACDLPLCLFETEFPSEVVRWRYSPDALSKVNTEMQRLWAQDAIRSTMIRYMLADLPSSSISHQHLLAANSSQSRNYKPLLQRPTCDSLENKIRHYMKRQKLSGPALQSIECEETRPVATTAHS